MPTATDQRKDPVHEYRGGWYYYDETWANRTGPYPTREAATGAWKSYAEYLDGSDDNMRKYWNYA
ncbi:hypothetical protein EVB87_115 [Rhizobium phage RHph_N28_1]|nr:hypothetical protein EVB87_115 [Rhizobium phage RHph_N28_1]QIG74144.1 hypothetical protein EVC07_116 [Rhizobium phage RHph_N42]QXV73802.1 hypothetical protein [Rhizobium phage RHph_N46]